MRALKATLLDDDKFALLALPFGGPIPRAGFPRGVDIDGETFTERTDIKPAWLEYRDVDWHHGKDATMRRTVIAKADHLRMEEDGWWVDVWLKHGERRVELVKRLAERATIYGSSESVEGLVRKAFTGEILVWPYMRQTLSTSPQNTYSIIRPLKATLEALDASGNAPSGVFWSDIEAALRDLGDDLRVTAGDHGAKAGRVLSATNETDLREALDAFQSALARMEAVLGRQPDYSISKELPQ